MKLKEFQKILQDKNLDCAVFYQTEKPNPNLFYFTGYTGAGFLVVTATDIILHVPSRDLSEAKQIKGVGISSGKKLSEMIKGRGISTKKVGIDFANISVIDFNGIGNSNFFHYSAGQHWTR